MLGLLELLHKSLIVQHQVPLFDLVLWWQPFHLNMVSFFVLDGQVTCGEKLHHLR